MLLGVKRLSEIAIRRQLLHHGVAAIEKHLCINGRWRVSKTRGRCAGVRGIGSNDRRWTPVIEVCVVGCCRVPVEIGYRRRNSAGAVVDGRSGKARYRVYHLCRKTVPASRTSVNVLGNCIIDVPSFIQVSCVIVLKMASKRRQTRSNCF